eukprot:gene16092-30971_t
MIAEHVADFFKQGMHRISGVRVRALSTPQNVAYTMFALCCIGAVIGAAVDTNTEHERMQMGRGHSAEVYAAADMEMRSGRGSDFKTIGEEMLDEQDGVTFDASKVETMMVKNGRLELTVERQKSAATIAEEVGVLVKDLNGYVGTKNADVMRW